MKNEQDYYGQKSLVAAMNVDFPKQKHWWSYFDIVIFNRYCYLLTSHCSLKKVGSVSRVNASTFSDNVGDQIRISLSIPDVARIEANRFGWTQLTIAESP